MNKRSRKFFVLKGIKGNNIQPKNGGNKKTAAEITADRDIILEAEHIVNKYMENMGYTARRVAHQSKTKKSMPAVLIISGAVFTAIYALIKIF